jgi:ATP-dependent exoDNAse (exonuclease V) beta subunit
MGSGTLTIYNASAGSGKTYKLTSIYLTNLFRSRYNYRKILAVTFTNKATAEMKSRILEHLHKLAAGENSGYLNGLIKETRKTEDWIRKEASEILNSILHDYSRFSVSTIDSFFQKVLRAFAREAGLHSGFSIELDHSTILSSAVDEMITSAAVDNTLHNWLIRFAMSNIEEEKSWNLKESIISLAEELFKEKYKILSLEERSKLEDKKFLLEYIEKIRSVSESFERKLNEYGKKAADIFSDFELSDDMFYRKWQGVPAFIRSLVSRNIKDPNRYVLEILNEPPRWSTGAISPQLQSALSSGLGSTLADAINYFENNIINYRSAESILSNIYALGILSDVLHNVHLITTSENSFLLSDAGEVLNLITKEDQSSFIYEKVGNRFENFMIDEFQDTSIIQWNNFKPLIENSMAEGFDNLVVGDVKQSIYRWRNSDWRILGTVLSSMVDNKRIFSEPLTTNWRSRSNIIRFNNALFSIIPDLVDTILSGEGLNKNFKDLYSEAVQADPCRNDGGYVRLEFIPDDSKQNLQNVVLDRIPQIIESLQEKGYKASDIGIIVRDGKEGALVLNKLIGHRSNSVSGKELKYNFNAVSNDSLLLSNSPVIIFIISALSVVNDPQDFINRAIMLRFYLMSTGKKDAEEVSLLSNTLIEDSRVHFSDGYEEFFDSVRQMTLFEAIERIIGFFRLGEYSWNVPFLFTFQDYIVNFAGSKNADIQTFLDWWEETGKKKSVVLPGNQDAIRILTIHKSKGLEFKAVILPFLSWNLDHMPSKQPVLWVRPAIDPFNDLGIVPVKYCKDLEKTIFAEDYYEEKYSAYLDNINLLYVAFTRAKDAFFAFSVADPRSENSIAGLLNNAITQVPMNPLPNLNLNMYYSDETHVFEYGEIPENINLQPAVIEQIYSRYSVSNTMESLRLKLHGENYFSSGSHAIRKKINYGKLMHEVFEGIDTPADISNAVRKLVLEGKLTFEESADVEKKVHNMIKMPQVADWFKPDNKILKEAGILLPSGKTRRPDRVIFKNGKTTIIDFKFGKENSHYTEQVDQYRKLLLDMGYKNIEAFIWYVDIDKIISA